VVEGALSAIDFEAPVELMAELAHAVPLAVMCELLDTGPDLAAQLWDESPRLIALLDPMADKEALDLGTSAAVSLALDLVPLVAQRRATPGPDLLSHLVHGETALDGDEAVIMTLTLLTAGHETTASLVANAVVTLWQHPDLFKALATGRLAVAEVLDELLRYESPVQLSSRVALGNQEIEGVRVEAGDQVLVAIGAANRDPIVFDEPDLFNPGRRCTGHIAFGHGPHFCAGAALARAESAEILTQLCDRVVDISQQNLTAKRGTSPTFRSFERLTLL
jgi:cytochrome P450